MMTEVGLRFTETIESYRGAVLRSGCVIVGYSGGADSSCLLRLMTDWGRENRIRIAAAHVNHCIRGDEADRDEAFCRRTADELGVEFFSLRADVPAIAEQRKMGIEQAARQVRYDFFDSVSEKLTGDRKRAVIATAHNADDNLETVLFHLMRGTGLRGLGGIDPFRDGRYLRPLINAGGDEIRKWCEENGVEYVTDSTNAETDYTRNRIRHIIVPEMKKIAPSTASSVTRMSRNLRIDRDWIEAEARRIADEKTLTRSEMAALHDALLSRVLQILYDRAKTSDASLEEKHIAEAARLIREGDTNALLSLPGAMRMTLSREDVKFEADTGRLHREDENAPEVLFTYPSDGETFTHDGYTVAFSQNRHDFHRENSPNDENIYKLSILTILRFDKISGVLRIRTKKDGDAYRYGGMTHRVKRMFSDRKLTADEKKRLPVLEDDCGIVWIPGFPLRDGLAYDGDGQPLTILYTERQR